MSSASSSAAVPSSPDRVEVPRDLASLHRDVWAVMRARPLIFVLLPAVLMFPLDAFSEIAALGGDEAMRHKLLDRFTDIVDFVVSSLVAAVVVAALKRMAAAEPLSLAAAFDGGLLLWGRVLRSWFVIGVVVILALLLFVVPGIYLLVCWSLVVPVIAFEGLGLDEAMKRSRALVRARGFFTVLGYAFAIYLIYVVIALVPATAVATALEGVVHPLVGVVVNLVGLAVMNVMASALTIGATLIYIDASETPALSPVGADLVRADGTRLPRPRSGRRGFIGAALTAGALLIAGAVAFALWTPAADGATNGNDDDKASIPVAPPEE